MFGFVQGLKMAKGKNESIRQLANFVVNFLTRRDCNS